ncbi:MAG: helix-turn-helix domain-containing protein [Phycisphaerales bacterium JB038]
MAKMFYSLDEAAQKLAVSEEEIRNMVSSGQIQEFRDGEKLLFKVEQIDLLAGGEEEDDLIPLASDPVMEEEEAGGVPLVEDSGMDLVEGSSIGLTDSAAAPSPESSGISVFDADDLDTADPSALTQISETANAEELNFETVGSGSGLLDLTQESDDTSLGAELLDEIYPGEDNVDVPASASGLFESEEGAAGEQAAAPVMAMAASEPFDGMWSGISMGLLFGALVALVVGVIIVATGLISGAPAIVPMIGDMNGMMMYGGGLVGLMIILAIIGAVIGKKS